MNRNATDKIAATFTDEPVNHEINVTLPGAVVEYLLRWAEVGLEKGDALPATAAWLGVVRDEVDNQVLLAAVRSGSTVMSGEEFLRRYGTPEGDAPDPFAPEGDGRPFATTLDASRHYALRRAQADELDNAGVWDAQGRSLIGGPDLS